MAVRTMLMNKIFIVAATCITIMGCATEGQYQTKLTTLVGQPKDVLIAKWGKPTGQYTDENGDEVVAYVKTRDIMVTGTTSYSGGRNGYSGGGYNGIMTGAFNPSTQTTSTGMPSGGVHLICMTKFIVHNSVIQSSIFKGNDCKARDW